MAIWADLLADNVAVKVCVETIYAAVYSGVLELKRRSVCAAAARDVGAPGPLAEHRAGLPTSPADPAR